MKPIRANARRTIRLAALAVCCFSLVMLWLTAWPGSNVYLVCIVAASILLLATSRSLLDFILVLFLLVLTVLSAPAREATSGLPPPTATPAACDPIPSGTEQGVKDVGGRPPASAATPVDAFSWWWNRLSKPDELALETACLFEHALVESCLIRWKEVHPDVGDGDDFLPLVVLPPVIQRDLLETLAIAADGGDDSARLHLLLFGRPKTHPVPNGDAGGLSRDENVPHSKATVSLFLQFLRLRDPYAPRYYYPHVLHGDERIDNFYRKEIIERQPRPGFRFADLALERTASRTLFKMLARAAKAGSRWAAWQLGIGFKKGFPDGIEEVESRKWIVRAAAMGCPDAKLYLSVHPDPWRPTVECHGEETFADLARFQEKYRNAGFPEFDLAVKHVGQIFHVVSGSVAERLAETNEVAFKLLVAGPRSVSTATVGFQDGRWTALDWSEHLEAEAVLQVAADESRSVSEVAESFFWPDVVYLSVGKDVSKEACPGAFTGNPEDRWESPPEWRDGSPFLPVD